MCIFIDDWKCNFAGTEITLEICKTCIKARTLYNQTKHDRALQKQKMLEANFEEEMRSPSKEQNVEENIESLGTPSEQIGESSSGESVSSVEKKETEEESLLESLDLSTEIDEEKTTSTEERDEEDFLDALESVVEKSETTTESTVEIVEPKSIIEMENFQGDLETLRNEPHGFSDGWLHATDKGERSSLRIDFPSPPDKLDPQKEQKILLKVRRTEHEFFFPPIPEVKITLFEGDKVVKETGKIEVEETDSQTITIPWTADGLSDPYGSDLNLLVETFSAGDEDTQNRVEIGGVQWRASLVEETHQHPYEPSSSSGPRKISPEEERLLTIMEEQ
ncbi:MAG: hypothetical protein ACOCTN_06265 [Candidatus Natronoplasma sp.]